MFSERRVRIMNKLMKRIVSGISAAAIFVSAMSLDVNIGTLYAEGTTGTGSETATTGTGKWGSYKDFDDLEKDTKMDGDNKIYNTITRQVN